MKVQGWFPKLWYHNGLDYVPNILRGKTMYDVEVVKTVPQNQKVLFRGHIGAIEGPKSLFDIIRISLCVPGYP